MLDVLSGRPERDYHRTVEAALVQDPALLEEPRPIPYQPMGAVEDGLPRPGCEAAVGEPGPHVRREVHLEEGVGHLGLREVMLIGKQS